MQISSFQKARARILLQDAKIEELSFATRLACVVEGVNYHCLGQEPNRFNVDESTSDSLQISFSNLALSEEDLELGRELYRWYENRWSLASPPCTVDEAIAWAAKIISER